MSEDFENKIKIYKEKSPKHLQNWKKIKALQHYSMAQEDDSIWEELEFLVRVYHKGFLWPSQEQLLDDMLAHYKIDYTKWAVKDGWVKMQMYRGYKKKPNHQQLEFWFSDLEQKRVDARSKSPIYSKLARYKLIKPRIYI